MIRLDLCHGASVDRLAAYISEFLLPLLQLLLVLLLLLSLALFLRCWSRSCRGV